MKDYKDEQRKAREAVKPKLVEPGIPQQFTRKFSRRKEKDRTFTKKGYAFGRRIGSREDNMIEHIAKRQR